MGEIKIDRIRKYVCACLCEEEIERETKRARERDNKTNNEEIVR